MELNSGKECGDLGSGSGSNVTALPRRGGSCPVGDCPAPGAEGGEPRTAPAGQPRLPGASIYHDTNVILSFRLLT